MKRIPIALGLLKIYLFLTIFLLSACSNVEIIEHIDVYVIEAWHYEVYDLDRPEQRDESLLEPAGYKKVNSIFTIEEGINYVATDIKAIEDFYDLDGKYIRTELRHTHYKKSTQKEGGENLKVELKEPSTILIPDNIEHFRLDTLTEEMKEKVKEHVLSFMDLL